MRNSSNLFSKKRALEFSGLAILGLACFFLIGPLVQFFGGAPLPQGQEIQSDNGTTRATSLDPRYRQALQKSEYFFQKEIEALRAQVVQYDTSRKQAFNNRSTPPPLNGVAGIWAKFELNSQGVARLKEVARNPSFNFQSSLSQLSQNFDSKKGFSPEIQFAQASLERMSYKELVNSGFSLFALDAHDTQSASLQEALGAGVAVSFVHPQYKNVVYSVWAPSNQFGKSLHRIEGGGTSSLLWVDGQKVWVVSTSSLALKPLAYGEGSELFDLISQYLLRQASPDQIWSQQRQQLLQPFPVSVWLNRLAGGRLIHLIEWPLSEAFAVSQSKNEKNKTMPKAANASTSDSTLVSVLLATAFLLFVFAFRLSARRGQSLPQEGFVQSAAEPRQTLDNPEDPQAKAWTEILKVPPPPKKTPVVDQPSVAVVQTRVKKAEQAIGDLNEAQFNLEDLRQKQAQAEVDLNRVVRFESELRRLRTSDEITKALVDFVGELTQSPCLFFSYHPAVRSGVLQAFSRIDPQFLKTAFSFPLEDDALNRVIQAETQGELANFEDYAPLGAQIYKRFGVAHFEAWGASSFGPVAQSNGTVRFFGILVILQAGMDSISKRDLLVRALRSLGMIYETAILARKPPIAAARPITGTESLSRSNWPNPG